MGKASKALTRNGKAQAIRSEVAVADLRTSEGFRGFMADLMAGVATGQVSHTTANACCNIAAKLIKVVELEYKIGSMKAPRRATVSLR